MGRFMRGEILTEAGAGPQGAGNTEGNNSSTGNNHSHSNFNVLDQIKKDSNNNLKYENSYVILSNDTDFQW